jgi:pilus assembly protein Flp/PilA
MKNFKQILNNLIVEESGQDLIEYALVAAVVGLGAVTALKGVATALTTAFTSIGSSITAGV